MRSRCAVFALLVGAAGPAATQEPVDTTLTIQGFLQRDNEVDVWTIVVPLPVQVLGTRTYVVPVVGKPELWGKYLNRYIGASWPVTRQPSEGIDVWDTTTIVPSPDARRFTMQRGGRFRDAIHFPEDAASRRGHYFAHVGVCDVDDYDITAEFDVR